jgi:hypothetical protein
MRKLLITILLLMFAAPCFGATLSWNAPTEGTPTGYKIYYNEYSQDLGLVLEVVDAETVLNLVPGLEYTMYVTAYNAIDESGPSNVITYTRPIFVVTDNPAPTITNIPTGSPVTINVRQ